MTVRRPARNERLIDYTFMHNRSVLLYQDLSIIYNIEPSWPGRTDQLRTRIEVLRACSLEREIHRCLSWPIGGPSTIVDPIRISARGRAPKAVRTHASKNGTFRTDRVSRHIVDQEARRPSRRPSRRSEFKQKSCRRENNGSDAHPAISSA